MPTARMDEAINEEVLRAKRTERREEKAKRSVDANKPPQRGNIWIIYG
jgi:hypothetical protein